MSSERPEDAVGGPASIDQWRQQAIGRSNCYGLPALVLRDVPTVNVVKQLRSPLMAESLRGLGYDIAQDLSGELEEVTRRLSEQYMRTFVGPGPHVSLFASVHHADERQLWGRSTVWVKQFIERTGLSFEGNWDSIPDHIGIELELMQRLAAYEADLWAQSEPGSSGRICQCLRMQEQFLREHLCVWAPQFCRRVIEASESAFYSKMAELTKLLVLSDVEHVAAARSSLQGILKSASGD